MSSDNDEFVIIFNGEIYNIRIKSTLEEKVIYSMVILIRGSLKSWKNGGKRV